MASKEHLVPRFQSAWRAGVDSPHLHRNILLTDIPTSRRSLQRCRRQLIPRCSLRLKRREMHKCNHTRRSLSRTWVIHTICLRQVHSSRHRSYRSRRRVPAWIQRCSKRRLKFPRLTTTSTRMTMRATTMASMQLQDLRLRKIAPTSSVHELAIRAEG